MVRRIVVVVFFTWLSLGFPEVHFRVVLSKAGTVENVFARFVFDLVHLLTSVGCLC